MTNAMSIRGKKILQELLLKILYFQNRPIKHIISLRVDKSKGNNETDFPAWTQNRTEKDEFFSVGTGGQGWVKVTVYGTVSLKLGGWPPPSSGLFNNNKKEFPPVKLKMSFFLFSINNHFSNKFFS